MKILAADDERLALGRLVRCIRNVAPEADVYAFDDPFELLKFSKDHPCEVAFLDVRMIGMTGVELARKLKETTPDVNLIFVTGYDEYTGAAMALHASGYITKPVTEEKIGKELDDLRRPIGKKRDALLQIRCFGNFDVRDKEGKPLYFKRKKARELLAYLVYRRGEICSVKEICAILFEDEEYNPRYHQRYFQTIISSMIATLKSVGAESAILRNYGDVALSVDLISCDWYDFLGSDGKAIDAYRGEFMAQYSWAEEENGYLTGFLKTEKKE